MLDGCVSRKETQRWKQEYGDFENKSVWRTVVVREYVDDTQRSLRAEAVAYLRERVQGGASAETVASELGVSGWSLSRWRRGLSPEKNSTLQLVEVVADCAEEGTKPLVTLVTPDGYRIEGLERDDVSRMLESLR